MVKTSVRIILGEIAFENDACVGIAFEIVEQRPFPTLTANN
jgi:hypothetical protein